MREFTAAERAVHFGRPKGFQDRDAALRAGMWFLATMGDSEGAAEWCAAKGIVTRAQGETGAGGGNTAGGYLVPEEVRDTILALREAYGVFRTHADVAPMARDVMHWPRRESGLSEAFLSEGVAATESSFGLGSIALVVKKLSILTKFSTELDEDAIPALGEFVAQEIAYRFAVKEDNCGWNGDGTSTYGGIRGITQILIDGAHNAGKVTATHNTFATLDVVDIGLMIGALPNYALASAKIYISNYGYGNTLARIGATGGALAASIGPDGRLQANFLGFPVVLVPVLPAAAASQSGKVMIAFGDLSLSSTLGYGRDITVARSTHRYFDTNTIAVRGTERFDIANHDLGDNTTAGPLIGLVGS